MVPSELFYENLRESKEYEEIRNDFEEARLPDHPRAFLVKIDTNKNNGEKIELHGILDMDVLALGDGNLHIPIKIPKELPDDLETLRNLFLKNSQVTTGLDAESRYYDLDLKYGRKYGNIETASMGLDKNWSLTLIRRVWLHKYPQREIPENESENYYIDSAIGLANCIESSLGWKITPLSYEEFSHRGE